MYHSGISLEEKEEGEEEEENSQLKLLTRRPRA
jgi:hypothetical protein